MKQNSFCFCFRLFCFKTKINSSTIWTRTLHHRITTFNFCRLLFPFRITGFNIKHDFLYFNIQTKQVHRSHYCSNNMSSIVNDPLLRILRLDTRPLWRDLAKKAGTWSSHQFRKYDRLGNINLECSWFVIFFSLRRSYWCCTSNHTLYGKFKKKFSDIIVHH